MKGILELTKREQRVVILIVIALVAIAFAKHWFEIKSRPRLEKSTSLPTASPTIHPEEEEKQSE